MPGGLRAAQAFGHDFPACAGTTAGVSTEVGGHGLPPQPGGCMDRATEVSCHSGAARQAPAPRGAACVPGGFAMTIAVRPPATLRAALKHVRAQARHAPRRRMSSPTPVRVAIADDSYLIREALEGVLSHIDGVELVASTPSG